MGEKGVGERGRESWEGGGGERGGEREGGEINREWTYLVCNAVGPWYGHLDIVETISNGHILDNITRMDHI